MRNAMKTEEAYANITAGSTRALLWAKQIIEHLGFFQSDTLESWQEYFRTGEPEHFFALRYERKVTYRQN